MSSQSLPALTVNTSRHFSSSMMTEAASPTEPSHSSPPSPPTYRPRNRSPLASPAITSASFDFASSSSKPTVQMIERRPSPPSFPRSRPLRPAVVGFTSMTEAPVKKEAVPINQKSRIGSALGGGPRKVKMLTGRNMKNCFELNLSGRELARVE